VFSFQGLGVTHAGLTDKFLDAPPISDRLANFRNQFFGHINREPLAPLAAIQGKAGMALSRGTRRAVLTDARALPQAQGSSCNRRKLLHLVMEPSDSLLGSFSHVYKSFCLHTYARARDFWQSVLLEGNICTFGQTMIQNQKMATEYESRGLAVVSGQTMVQKWPNDGSSHTCGGKRNNSSVN